MDRDATITRRTVIAGTAAVAGTFALTACGGGGSPAGTRGNAPAGAAAQPADPLTQVSTVPVGGAVGEKGPDGKPIIIAQPEQGTIVAFSAICTHMGCTVAPAGNELHCPCHGSVYDAFTGKVLRGPAPRPLPPVAVHVDNGEVIAGKA